MHLPLMFVSERSRAREIVAPHPIATTEDWLRAHFAEQLRQLKILCGALWRSPT